MTGPDSIKEKFARAKACYEQNFLQFRSLNDQMNRVPTIAVTLTGGLWYGATIAAGVNIVVKFGLLLFAGIANIALILSAYRIRDVMSGYLEKIEEYDPSSFVTGSPTKPSLPQFGNYSMISIYSALMGAGALLSFIAAFFFYSPFGRALSCILFMLALTIVYIVWRGFVGKRNRRQ